ncbi:hypothetical protein SISSUDRAFT_886536 [Sistotremastrum suecicum HHB10207 ss-3]|uniref:Uncharacterized protein n=1 Tax=Sistotremastrum suecicum HHB10207 ss-3 TaxID=1314776 RepID=A0A166C797_9AGAM|nr:hypothetical protein SISSUDRAFT_886536 [Sistotremastrum suecicum HHB10207 ss-3]
MARKRKSSTTSLAKQEAKASKVPRTDQTNDTSSSTKSKLKRFWSKSAAGQHSSSSSTATTSNTEPLPTPSPPPTSESQDSSSVAVPNPEVPPPTPQQLAVRFLRAALAEMPVVPEAPPLRDPERRRIVFNCHETTSRELKDEGEKRVSEKRAYAPTTNKLRETCGDKRLGSFVDRICEPLAKTTEHHRNIVKAFSCNDFLGYLVYRLGWHLDPDFVATREDLCELDRWEQSLKKDPSRRARGKVPKFLPNIGESYIEELCAQNGGDDREAKEWMRRIIEPLFKAATIPGDEFSSNQTNPYPAKSCALCCEREMLDYVDEVSRPIILHGQILWYAVWKETGGQPMKFDKNENLLSPHSHVLESGDALFKTFATDGLLLSQPANIFERPESPELAVVAAALLDLLTSPEISGYLGGLVGLHLFFAEFKDRQKPSKKKLSQAFTAAMGWFGRHHDKDLVIMEPFMKLVVARAMKTLIAHGMFIPNVEIRFD